MRRNWLPLAGLVVLGFALFLSGVPRGDLDAPASAQGEPTIPAGVEPIPVLDGDSNDSAAAAWTPPVPLDTGGSELVAAFSAWTSGLSHEVTNPPLPTPIPTPTPVPTGPVVYLTFDDGPSSTWTPQILDLLDQYHAKATFFVIGTNAFANPSVFARMTDSGQGVGNHTYSHLRLTTASYSAIYDQLGWTFSGGTHACGFTDCCFRAPYGATNPQIADMARGMGFSSWLWDVDPEDWKRPGAPSIAYRVVANVRPGSVVLLHDGGGDRSQTVAALAAILDELDRRGYQFRSLPC